MWLANWVWFYGLKGVWYCIDILFLSVKVQRSERRVISLSSIQELCSERCYVGFPCSGIISMPTTTTSAACFSVHTAVVLSLSARVPQRSIEVPKLRVYRQLHRHQHPGRQWNRSALELRKKKSVQRDRIVSVGGRRVRPVTITPLCPTMRRSLSKLDCNEVEEERERLSGVESHLSTTRGRHSKFFQELDG